MGEVVARLAVSLDGYIAGPESGPEHPLGIGGERLHSWVFGLRSFRRMQGMTGGAGGPDDELLAWGSPHALKAVGEGRAAGAGGHGARDVRQRGGPVG